MSPVVLPAGTSSQCHCALPAPLARAAGAWPDLVLTVSDHLSLLSFALAASPSLQAFQESAKHFLALLLDLLAEPADSEMRLCQQSLLVRVPLSSFSPPSPPLTEALGLGVHLRGRAG